MGLAHSPKVVTDGLVFYTDMGNTEKSWKGKPTTNVIENDISQFSSDNGCTIELQPHTFQSQPVYRVTFPSGTLPRIRTNFSYTTGQQFTGSIFYRVISAGSNTVNLIFRENNFGTTYTSTGLTSTVWVKTNISHTFSGSGTSMFLLYQSNSGAILPNVIDFCMPQVELSSFATPFVDGTRSNTQALLDMTGQNTVTATSLTYASDGTFNFNGSNNYIDSSPIALTGTSTQSLTWACWVSSAAANGDIINMRSSTSGWNMCPIFASGQQFYAKVWNNSTLGAGTTFNLNQYYYLVLVRDNETNTNSFYVNGQLVASQTGSYSSSGSPNNHYFGRAGSQATNTHLNGNIPVGQIYIKALSAEEVQQNFNALKGRYGL